MTAWAKPIGPILFAATLAVGGVLLPTFGYSGSTDLDLDDPALDAMLFGAAPSSSPTNRAAAGDLDLDDPAFDAMLSGAAPSNMSAAGGNDLNLDDPALDDALFGPGAASMVTPASNAGQNDPLESWNRSVFGFNDFVYTNMFKPVATGYQYVVPEMGRTAIGNFFENLTAPAYFVNALLQGKVKEAGTELGRFSLNSTLGIAGLMDVAGSQFQMASSKEDLGQTLGVLGLSEGPYLVLPLVGPSNVRDTVGMTGDWAFSPLSYASIGAAGSGIKTLNSHSSKLLQYEKLTSSALDPYIAVRHAYSQSRANEIKK